MNKRLKVLNLRNCTYIIDEKAQKCTTTFSDGKSVDAVPMDNQIGTAKSLGYKDNGL
jgi:hypothetical protein